jgi:hypothetical protein
LERLLMELRIGSLIYSNEVIDMRWIAAIRPILVTLPAAGLVVGLARWKNQMPKGAALRHPPASMAGKFYSARTAPGY